MEPVKLLLADVDGTLVTKDKVLTDRAIAAVRQLREHGIGFAVTSGRPPKGMTMLIEPLALDTPIAGFNGGVYVNPDLTVREARTLPRDVAERTLAMILEHGLDAWVYTQDAWLVRDRDAPHVAREQWTVKFEPHVVASFDDVLDEAVKIVGCSDDLDTVAACEKDVQDALGERASAARSQPYYLDVTHPQANKGAVVDYLAAQLKIPPGAIATIGDQPNDVHMFRRGGLSIAMGNASDAVKRQADEVTASYDDEGFAKAVERFLLKAS